MRLKRAIAGVVISIGMVTPLGLYAKQLSDRPPQTALKQILFQGVIYERRFLQLSRPQMVHILQLDLTEPSLRPFVTPGVIDPAAKTDTLAQTTSEFLQAFDLQIAVNAGFFNPFLEKTPWDFHPRSGDRTDVLGEFISDGDRYSEHPVKWPKLCFMEQHAILIEEPTPCPPQTRQAVSGNVALHPRPIDSSSDRHQEKKYPRTIAALNQTGQTLWLVVADGKQSHYSEGLQIAEAEALLFELGATVGLNLDGGGSVTLVAETNNGAQVLNAPIHGKWPMTERPIANHLGFYATSAD